MRWARLGGAFALFAVLATAAQAWPLRTGALGGSGGGGAPVQLALQRTFNNPSTTAATPATAFWIIGQPFVSDPSSTPDVPPGNAVTATLNGNPVRAQFCERKLDAKGDVAWSQVVVDLSGAAIPDNGGQQNLVFTSAPGSWTYDGPGNHTNANWEALNDTVVLSNVTTTSASGADMNSGPYTATFNGGSTNTVWDICNGAVVHEVQVVANAVNTGGTAHCYLQVVADYAVMYKSDGTLGPIASEFNVENFQIVNKSGCTGAPGVFTADLAWYRNGTLMRQYKNVTITPETGATLMRPDAQWDWNEDDPGVWVSQDYTKVTATYKTPAYIPNIAYTGAQFGLQTSVPVTAYSGGVFTFSGASANLYSGDIPSPAVAIEFEGSLGGLSGLSLGTVYWLDTSNKTLYDTEADAYAAGTTGQIVPTGTYSSGLTAVSVFAPENLGTYDSNQPGTGSKPELGVQSEWVTAYLIGNTQAWQNVGRVAAFNLLSDPSKAINSTTGALPMLISVSGTSTLPNMNGGTGLGTALTSTRYFPGHDYSSDINGGAGPTSGTGLASQTGLWSISPEHPPAPGFLVWLLEGNPYLQRMIVLNGNHQYANSIPYNREYSYSGVGGGATYEGSMVTGSGLNDRQVGWAVKDLAYAAFAAPAGSAEEKLDQEALENEADFEIAYQAYKGSNFQLWGEVNIDDSTSTGSPVLSGEEPYGTNFMTSFNNISWAYASLLLSDFDPDVKTMADNVSKLQVAELNDNCPYFATAYNPLINTEQGGQTPVPPAGYVSSAAEIGVGDEWFFSFSGTTVTVTNTTGTAGTWSSVYSTANPPFANGDIYRPFDDNSDGGAGNAPPSPLVIGQDYYVCDVGVAGAGTFELSATKGNCSSADLITFATAVTGAGGVMVPAGQGSTTPGVGNCPQLSAGSMHSTFTPDSYGAWMMGGICLQAEDGAPGAASACATAAAMAVGTRTNSIFNGEAMWAIQASPGGSQTGMMFDFSQPSNAVADESVRP